MASRCPYRYYPSKNNPQSRRNPQANSSLQVHTSNLSEHSVFPAAGSWLPYSAATSYMTPDVSLLINPTIYTESEKVMVGNGFHIPISLVGSAILHTPTKSFTLSNVLFVPNLTQNLISVGVFTVEHNCKIGFTPWGYEITDLDSQLVLAEGVIHQNLYHIASKPSFKALTSIVASPAVWHKRLGHPDHKIIHTLKSANHINFTTGDFDSLCHSCQLGKSKRLTFASSDRAASSPLEIVHCDMRRHLLNHLLWVTGTISCL